MSKRQKTKSRKSQREATPRTNWVRFNIEWRKGRRLRVLIYARFSTDEQNQLSIEAQISYCKRFLAALDVTDFEVVVIFDPGISGEKMFRPGINEVRAGIDAGQWDLIIVEDSSRLFRNAMACVELVNAAVDQNIRMICINDEIDTADEEYWEDRLYDAARHHARSNKFTARRISRAHEELWEQGAAIGMLKPGYRRKPTHPAKDGEPESGPSFDERDPQQVPILEQLYQRAAALESPRSLAQWLTKIGFRKANNASSGVWTAKNVIALIRRTDYRGVQTFRKIISKKKRVTGERRAAHNDADKVLTRDMPQLRIVSDALWYQANKAINDRNSCPGRPRGEEHPLAGIPRNSRGPLSNIFCCGCCHGKMYAEGRTGYRCSQIHRGRCWNRATALQDATHRWLGETIARKLLSLDDCLDRLLEKVREFFADQGHRATRRAELLEKKQSLEVGLERLSQAIEMAEEPPETLVKKIEVRESELAFTVAELSGLELQHESLTLPTRQQVAEQIVQFVGQLRHMDRGGRDDLERLTGRIEAVPYQQYGGNKVVLRARFELHLAALLPFQTRAALAGLCDASIDVHFESIPMLVDLFEPSTGPRYGLAAVRLAEDQKLGLTAVGKSLGINKRCANIAVLCGRSLQAAGLTDPYIELTQPPVRTSRRRSIQPSKPEPTREAA